LAFWRDCKLNSVLIKIIINFIQTEKMEQEELKNLEKKALEQMLSGKSLFGRDGAYAPLLKSFIEKALEAEMDGHLDESERSMGNKRNGKGKKALKTGVGTFDIQTPADRHGSFEPELVRKRQTILADNLSEKIIGLYGLGMSLLDISGHIKEMYDTDISHTVLSQITDRIIPDVKAWQNRPLEPLYCIVWLDAMHYKVKVDGKIEHKALYNILGVNKEGIKEVLGMYISESKGANFWLQVLTDLNQRGLEDILIACTDNLNGFTQGILSIFPKTQVQKCIVHQIQHIKTMLKKVSIRKTVLACLADCPAYNHAPQLALFLYGTLGTIRTQQINQLCNFKLFYL